MKVVALIFSLFLLIGCKKAEFKRYNGKYDVRHFSHIWESGEPTEYIVEDKTISIFRDGDFVDVVGNLVHIDSLERDVEYYSGSPKNHFSLKFINDSIYYYNISSSETGGVIHSYKGAKKD